MNELLTPDTFFLYCAKHYDGRHCSSTQEFYEDLKRIRYIKKLITRYIQTGELKERLILNHIIILSNVFGPVVTCRILYFKLRKQFKYIKPFLVMLDILADKIHNIDHENSTIDVNCIEMDQGIIEALRKI